MNTTEVLKKLKYAVEHIEDTDKRYLLLAGDSETWNAVASIQCRLRLKGFNVEYKLHSIIISW